MFDFIIETVQGQWSAVSEALLAVILLGVAGLWGGYKIGWARASDRIQLLESMQPDVLWQKVQASRAIWEEESRLQIESALNAAREKERQIEQLGQRSKQDAERLQMLTAERNEAVERATRLAGFLDALRRSSAPIVRLVPNTYPRLIRFGSMIDISVNAAARIDHDIRRVEIRISGLTVCSQTYAVPLGSTPGVATIVCRIASDNASAPTGRGRHTVEAVGINGAGSIVAIDRGPDFEVT